MADTSEKAGPGAAASDAAATGADRRFGWRAGILLGAVVLLVVYAVAELTAYVPPLRDAVEHLPLAIAVLVLGTVAVLGAIVVKPLRR